MSVAFAHDTGAPIEQVYELRYSYTVSEGELLVQRQPSPAWNGDFPRGPWRNEAVDAVLAG